MRDRRTPPPKVISNCWIEAFRLQRVLGGSVVFVPTLRDYRWGFKAPHCYWLSACGRWKIEFIPVKETLGDWPLPLFSGHYRVERIYPMINPTLASLIAELKQPDYAALTDQQATDRLNTAVATGDYQSYRITDLTLDDLFGPVRRAKILALFDSVAATLLGSADPETAGRGEVAARSAELLRDRSGGGFDLGRPNAVAELPSIVAAGILTQAEADQLLALVQIFKSPAAALGHAEIPLSWVVNIRAAITAGEV